jgi:hypothetical protein
MKNLIFTDGSIFSNIWATNYQISGRIIIWEVDGLEGTFSAYIIEEKENDLICEWLD